MAVTINASTSAGAVITPDTSGVLALQTAGTTAVTVDASQNVGIGTASPSSRLNILDTSANGLRISGEGDHALGFTGYTGGASTQIFSIRNDGISNLYINTQNSVPLNLGVSTGTTFGSLVSNLRIGSSGNVTLTNNISVGNATPSTSGTGITFPATQSASTDANTLDDYEEGTFTPSITSSSGSLGYAGQYGKYTKIGNTVVCTFWIQWTSNSSLSGAQTFMQGLPFVSATGNQRPSPSIRASGFSITGIVGGWNPNSSQYIQINVFNNGGQADIAGSSLGASGEFGGTLIYQTT